MTWRRTWRRTKTRIRGHLRVAIGDITFGMEDGAVSVAGLVFGVAASTNDSSIVLLAGAAGAVSGAVSMMAGTYLDVQSVEHRQDAAVTHARDDIARNPQPYLVRAGHYFDEQGFTADETRVVTTALARNPEALLDHVCAHEIGTKGPADGSPTSHAIWMFFADLLAASVPVIPFAIFPIEQARIVSLLVTGALMAVLGFARGRIGHVNVWRTAIETMAIAGAAALAGVIIGHVVS